MAGCVGHDQFGHELIAGLRAAGVDADEVQAVARPTGTALITVDAAGNNTIVVISGANLACDKALVDRALAIAGGPGILLLQHEIPPEVNDHAIRAAHDAGWFVILNPAPARPVAQALLPLIDIIVPNETEAAKIAGGVVAGRTDALAVGRRLVAQGTRAALVTLGGDGALYCDASVALHCPAVAERPHDSGEPRLRRRQRGSVGDPPGRTAVPRFTRGGGGFHRTSRFAAGRGCVAGGTWCVLALHPPTLCAIGFCASRYAAIA
jgi:ribokinase